MDAQEFFLQEEGLQPLIPMGRRTRCLWGTAATVTASILNGAHIVRVHDVAEMVQVARVTDCVLTAGAFSARHATRV